MIKTLPELIHFGLYDASVVHKNKTVTPNRKVSLYEIEFVIEDGGFSYINDNIYKLKKNSVIVAKPGHIRHTVPPFKALYIHLIVEDMRIASLLDNTPDFFEPENYPEYKNIMEQLIEAATSSHQGVDFEIITKLFTLFLLFDRNIPLYRNTPGSSKSNIAIVKKALQYMDENFQKNITLNDVAQHVHFSRIYFRNIFVAATGISPNKYLLNKRLATAKQLLITTDKNISQIAFESGFSSQSYMNYVFRQEENISPLQYKKKNLLDE